MTDTQDTEEEWSDWTLLEEAAAACALAPKTLLNYASAGDLLKEIRNDGSIWVRYQARHKRKRANLSKEAFQALQDRLDTLEKEQQQAETIIAMLREQLDLKDRLIESQESNIRALNHERVAINALVQYKPKTWHQVIMEIFQKKGKANA